MDAKVFEHMLEKYLCVKEGNLYSQVEMSEQYVNNRILLLSEIILERKNSCTSGTHLNQLLAIQEDISIISRITGC